MATLFDILADINAGSFVSVVSVTEPKLLKRGNPYNGMKVEKITKAVLQYGYSYENAVNNRIAEGEEFKADELPWGEWVEGFENKILMHKGELYARFYEKKNDHREVIYLINGQIATEEQVAIIKQFTPKSNSKKQEEVGLEYEEQVKPRTYKFSSIVSLKCGKLEYNRFEVGVAVE